MTTATSRTALEERLASLVDLERSHGFHAGHVALDLRRMEGLLAALPELPWPRVAVHVAGSEGKTSTTELVAAGLAAHGLATATYTSPHLVDPRERLRIGGAFPDEELLARAMARVDRAAASAGETPTVFEYLTALARVLFAEAGVDAVVWETGLGGRLDATRLMHADLAVVTSISLEHTAVLGGTLSAIAAEKAGILRPGAPLALGAGVPPEAGAVLRARAAELGCAVSAAPRQPDVRAANRALARLALDLLAGRGLVPPRGAAVDAALDAHAVRGRFQRVGDLLLDGAHTVAAQATLARELVDEPLGALLFGATSGRDAAAMLRPWLDRGVGRAGPGRVALVLTRAPGGRAIDPAALLAALPAGTEAVVVDDPLGALAVARAAAPRGATILATGSLYLVGALLRDLGE